MRRALVVASLFGMLLAPVTAAADPITAYTIFAGNVVNLGNPVTIAGQIGANATVSAFGVNGDNFSTLESIKTAGNVDLGNSTTVTGNVIASGFINMNNSSVIKGDAHSSVASGSTGLFINNSLSKVEGTYFHNNGSLISLGGGATLAGSVPNNACQAVPGSVPAQPCNIVGSPTAYVPVSIPAANVTLVSKVGSDPGDTSQGTSHLIDAGTPTLALAPGTYNDIVTNGSGRRLVLSAGTYYFDTWNFDINTIVEIPATGNVFLYFTGNVTLNPGFTLVLPGVSPPLLTSADANRIYAELLGNWSLQNGVSNAGKQSWVGTVFGSGATSNVSFGTQTTVIGAAWARNNFNADNGFTLLAAAPIPPNGAVPEPATLLLVGTGLAFAASRLRRKK